MALSDVPQEFREALALHQLFVAFGIAPDDIFASYTDGHFWMVARQGAREFRVGVGQFKVSAGEFARAWSATVVAYNASSPEERVLLLETSYFRPRAVMLYAGMISKGFVRPGSETVH